MNEFPVGSLKGVGAQTASRLAKLGIHSIQDLLFHLPLRYEDRTRLWDIGSLAVGQHALIEGRVEETRILVRSRSSLLCRISDATGRLTLRFFHFTERQRQTFAYGRKIRCYGEVRFGFHEWEMVHPEYEWVGDDEQGRVASSYTPIYPLTQGLHQKALQRLVKQAVDQLRNNPDSESGLKDWIPGALLRTMNFPNLKDALLSVHTPPLDCDIESFENGKHRGQRRLAFEELLAHHLSLSKVRKSLITRKAAVMEAQKNTTLKFLQDLPFRLTAAQLKVIREIQNDLESGKPMMRLLLGDVGSGKTVVAAYSALTVIGSQHQVSLMAPTELLAEQHYRSFLDWFEPLGIQTVLITGKDRGKARDDKLNIVREGYAGMVIGTHALFQDDVEFSRLGLMVIDEQHRFGVNQRLALRKKGSDGEFYPHQLVMTATPIPRTLAMLKFADLDISIIDERPPGRLPVKTSVIAADRKNEIIARILSWVKSRRQIYWVCTLIEESELLQVEAAENSFRLLKESLPKVSIALIHGRMKPLEKEKIMASFKVGDIDMLVATTVIEVGVDIPNAGLMIIENAERLGLFQLHQLRGRVGRGVNESYCVLMYRSPLSRNARERLSIIRETTDGFKIAEKDLQLRGPGEVLGTRQTGQLQMRVANLARDKDLISNVQQAAKLVLQDYPDNVQPLIQRWIGDSSRYAEV